MKKIQTLIILQALLVTVFCSKIYTEQSSKCSSCQPINSKEKIHYLKKNFKQNKKYQVLAGSIELKKLLIGRWNAPPVGQFNFLKNGELAIEYYSNGRYVKEYGNWKVEGYFLYLKLNDPQIGPFDTWQKYHLKYIKTGVFNESKHKYQLMLHFGRSLFSKFAALDLSYN